MVLFYTDHTAWQFGEVSKFVCCEKCDTEFGYTMFRQASGQAISLYFLDEEGAAERAQRRADTKLQRALDFGLEPVECPQCGCFQESMIWEARRRYLRKFMGPRVALIALVIVVPIAFCGGAYVNGVAAAAPIVPWNSFMYAMIGLTALIVLMPFVRFFLSLRYDPNHDSSERRVARGYGLGMRRADYERMRAGDTSGLDSPSPAVAAVQIEAVKTAEASANYARQAGTDAVFMDRPLSQLFGKDIKSNDIVDFRKSIAETPVEDRFDPQIIFYSWKKHGLAFEFHLGKLVFIFLYAEGFEGFKQYRGEVPMNLAFSDTRADVERKLGKPEVLDNMDGILPVSASYTSKGIKVAFVSKDLKNMANRIESVGLFPVKH